MFRTKRGETNVVSVLPPFKEGTGMFYNLQRGDDSVPPSWWRPVISDTMDHNLLHVILTEGLILYVISYSPLYVRSL